MSQKQRVLLVGMDCLPGQMDLFPTDGEPALDNEPETTCDSCWHQKGAPPSDGAFLGDRLGGFTVF